MPSGYTADVQSGKITEFRDFAMACARAFGATITMRDDPADAAIPETFTPSSYHQDERQTSEQHLAEVRAWSAAEAERQAQAFHAGQMAAWTRRMAERRIEEMRYRAMLAHVEAWIPPTSEHAQFKTFMREQLIESIKFDCSESPGPIRLDGKTFRAKMAADACWSVEYHTKQYAEEVARAAQRTAWLASLRASLIPVPTR